VELLFITSFFASDSFPDLHAAMDTVVTSSLGLSKRLSTLSQISARKGAADSGGPRQESGARVSAFCFSGWRYQEEVLTVMIALNSEYESRRPWIWKESFSFVPINKKIHLTLNC